MFKDRVEAARKLADKLRVEGEVLVLGIPRGGVVLSKVIAGRYGWPMDVLITKKISFPGQPELAMGAIAEDGKPVWHKQLSGRVSRKERNKQEKGAREKVKRYIKEFRRETPLRTRLRGVKTVIIVDDGIATGQTIEAGIKYLRGESLQVIVAVPVCAKETATRLKKLVDDWICLEEPEFFRAVGQYYSNFSEVSDKQVKRHLVR